MFTQGKELVCFNSSMEVVFTQGKELVCLIPPWKSSVYTG